MIKIKDKKKHCDVKAIGKTSDLLSELAFLVATLLGSEEVNERMIEIAVELGKAKAKGKEQEYMDSKLKEVLAEEIEKEENEG